MSPAARRTWRVLLIDDDASTRFFVRTAFEAAGFEFAEADRGERALGMLAQCAPDLVLLDYKLLGMDGIACCRLIRGCWRGPLFMLSGREDPLLPAQALAAGADRFVRKPTNWLLLARTARDWLVRQSRPDRVAGPEAGAA
jgi:DNA-binding response OmpR family regulator